MCRRRRLLSAFLFLFTLQVCTLLMLPVMPVSANSGTEIVGVVPRLLSAMDDNNARCYESSLGSAVADAVRISFESDVAIICGGDLAYGLLPGEATYDEIKNVFAEDREIAVASVTIKELRQILERGLAYITLDESERIDEHLSVFDGFPQISGFELYYDVSAPQGERVYELLINGESVDLDSDTYTVTLGSTAHMLKGGYGLPPVDDVTASELTLSAVMLRYIVNGLNEYSPTGRRMHVRGVNDAGILADIPIMIFPVVTVVFLVAYLSRSKRETDTKARSETPWY